VKGPKGRASLEALVQTAQGIAGTQRQAVQQLRRGWQLHVVENSRAAGAEMARTFGDADCRRPAAAAGNAER
jgi:hypothetical protein